MQLRGLERFTAEQKARIQRALEFATQQHAKQTRKDGKTPYIVHPIAVAQMLIDEFHADADIVIAGLLHDTVEDTGATLDQIEGQFGPQVRFFVDAVTDPGQGDGGKQISDKIKRAEFAKVKILDYAGKDPRVLIVKIADRFNNMKTVDAFTPRGQVGYSYDTLNFHVVHARRLGYAKIANELEEMCRTAIARWES